MNERTKKYTSGGGARMIACLPVNICLLLRNVKDIRSKTLQPLFILTLKLLISSNKEIKDGYRSKPKIVDHIQQIRHV